MFRRSLRGKLSVCMLEAMEGELCLLGVLEVPEVVRRVLLLYAGGLCLQEVLEVLEVPEVMCCVLLCVLEVFEVLEMLEVMRCVPIRILEAVEGGLCLLEVLEVTGRVLLCMLEADSLFAGGVGRAGAGGTASCAALCAGGCVVSALFARGAGGAGGDARCTTLYARGNALCAAPYAGCVGSAGGAGMLGEDT